MVLAGAVAVAIAPSTRAKSQSRLKINLKNNVTITPADKASKRVITKIRFPVRNSTSRLKNFPTPKAMKASAKSLTKPICVMMGTGMKSRQHGPINTPARI